MIPRNLGIQTGVGPGGLGIQTNSDQKISDSVSPKGSRYLNNSEGQLWILAWAQNQTTIRKFCLPKLVKRSVSGFNEHFL